MLSILKDATSLSQESIFMKMVLTLILKCGFKSTVIFISAPLPNTSKPPYKATPPQFVALADAPITYQPSGDDSLSTSKPLKYF